MRLLECSWLNGKKLHIRSDIPSGWRRTEKNSCFSEKVNFDWEADCRARAVVSVFQRGYKPFDPDPYVLDHDDEMDGLRYIFRSNYADLFLSLIDGNGKANPNLKWGETPSHKPRLHWQISLSGERPSRNMEIPSILSYELQVLVVLSPILSPGPTNLEWSRRFFSGGLPSLGKRR